MRFLFQPLCENAIQHGMEAGKPLHIVIRGWQEEKMMHLAVENDGAMIPPDKLALLQAQAAHAPEGQGIGLGNLSARLRLLYGADADMTVTSNRERTRIALRFLPKKPEETQTCGKDAGKDENACGC